MVLLLQTFRRKSISFFGFFVELVKVFIQSQTALLRRLSCNVKLNKRKQPLYCINVVVIYKKLRRKAKFYKLRLVFS